MPFTYELRASHRLNDDEIKNLQFYSSHQITLRREVQSQDRQVTSGHRLRLVSGRSVEEVVIPAKTPGVAMAVTPHTISVSFVTGTTLDFNVGGDRVPLSSYGDFVRPLAVLESTGKSRPAAGNLLGQYAEPPGGSRQGPVKIANDPIRPRPTFETLAGNYFLGVEPSGQIPFGGLVWEAVDDTAKAYLLIDADKLEETEEKRTVLPGVRLGN